MATKMKSFRLAEDTIYDLKAIAKKLDITETGALELCIDWFYKSGAIYALEEAKKNSNMVTPQRSIDKATYDGEITNTVKAKIWIEGMR